MFIVSEYDKFSVRVPTGIVLAEGPVGLLDPHDMLSPEDTIVSKDLRKAIKDIEPTSFGLVDGGIDREVLATAQDALFNELPDLGLTRDESANDVRFGQLIVHSMFGDERAELAALKPFQTVNKAAHEFSLSRYFSSEEKRHGFRTFVPLGIARLATGEYGLLTKYEHGVLSLDNVLWNPEHRLQSTIVDRAIGKCAFILGSLHAAGWTHGDAQVKNMFVSNHDEVFVGDLESTQPFTRTHDTPNEQAIHTGIEDDLRTLVDSLTSRRDDDEKLSTETSYLFSLIYTAITTSPNSAIPLDVRKQQSEVREFFK